MNLSNYSSTTDYFKMLTHCQACYFDTNFLHFVYYEPLWGKQYNEPQYIKLQFLTYLIKMQQSG